MREIDFSRLNQELLQNAEQTLLSWLPNGKLKGKEFVVGDLGGNPGKSLSINTSTGKWSDFATGEAGNDLVSLYAKINNIKNGEAATALSGGQIDSYVTTMEAGSTPAPDKKVISIPDYSLCKPPAGTPPPEMDISSKRGTFIQSWEYKDSDGSTMFYVARYSKDGEKTFLPWSWCNKSRKWVAKGWKAPRPLYGLEELARLPSKKVLLVEGEKAADAARAIVGDRYAVVSWPNGIKAIKNVDWSPLKSRELTYWPDADKHGSGSIKVLLQLLAKYCTKLKYFDIPDNNGWDAADAYDEGFNWKAYTDWGKPLVKSYGVKDETPPQLPEKSDSAIENYQNFGVATSSNGKAIANLRNVLSFLNNIKHEPTGEPVSKCVWYDSFHAKIFTNLLNKSSKADPEEWSERHDLIVTEMLQREYGFNTITDNTVSKAIVMIAMTNTSCEPRDWMEKLVWDGTDRLNLFCSVFLGSELNIYTEAVSKNFWLSMIARIYEPGCKVDTVMILEGAQGINKSRALQVIGGKWFAEVGSSIESKDFYQAIQGKMLIELGELASITSKAAANKVKQVITCAVDRYRPSYDRYTKDFPRCCIFAGTTNTDDWNLDDTGARRFMPIRCGTIDIDLLKKEREQLFAEAVHRYKNKENWHEYPLEIAKAEQEARKPIDVWTTEILGYIENKDFVQMKDLARDLFDIHIKEFTDQRTQKRIANILKAEGWSVRRQRINGKPSYVWRKFWDFPH